MISNKQGRREEPVKLRARHNALSLACTVFMSCSEVIVALYKQYRIKDKLADPSGEVSRSPPQEKDQIRKQNLNLKIFCLRLIKHVVAI